MEKEICLRRDLSITLKEEECFQKLHVEVELKGSEAMLTWKGKDGEERRYIIHPVVVGSLRGETDD